jgi:hypothetical protein
LRLELLHMILFIVCDIYFRNNVTVLFYVRFSTVQAVPFVSSGTFHCSDIEKLECIVLSVAARKNSVAIVSDINSITADVWSIYACNWTLFSYIVNLHCVVPTTRQ